MKEFLGRLWMLGWQIAALALVAFIFWFALRSHAYMWRLVTARYRRKQASTSTSRKLEVAVIAARDMRMPNPLRNRKYRSYPGLLLGIHDEGLAFSLVPPFNLMCPPIFLPFDEMELKQTQWALWREPFAIRMQQLPDTDIIIGSVTVHWIRQHVDRPPFSLEVD